MSSTTSNDHLNSIVKRMTPGADQRTAMSEHRGRIEKVLKSKGLVMHFWETGSWSHGTAVQDASDVDYFAVMNGPRPASAYEALTALRTALTQGLEGVVSVQVDRPAVSVNFWTGTKIEITPAYVRGDWDYYIPDPNSAGWLESGPKKHLDYVTAINTRLNGKAKHLVRLVKTWKHLQHVPMSSFYLEMRTAKYADGESAIIYSIDVPRVFQEIQSFELAAMNDPTKSGRRIESGAQGELEKGSARMKLHQAVYYAEKARTAEADGDPLMMRVYWDLLFGL